MKILVLVKEVPDTYGDRRIVPETGLLDRAASDRVPDEIGERAIEAGLTLQAAVPDTTVTIVSMGPAEAGESIRKGLAMGADDAIHIADEQLLGADLTLTAEVLAAVIRRQTPDLVIAGNLSTDGGSGVLPAMLAEHLGWPHATNLATLQVDGVSVSGERQSDAGVATVTAALPAVVSITEAMPEARFPSFKGIMGAKRKPVMILSCADLKVRVDDVAVSRSIVIAASQRPPRDAGVTIVDEGDGGQRLAAFLLEQKLV
ncbi:MAG TPA: electron transfer flavoprotein subunit beta/FixA family protein [Microbacteriaceae bacterium]|nr:electron transfer flavoprotein subunit beta/FixA family protein [Microbacteriaceae bacterium]